MFRTLFRTRKLELGGDVEAHFIQDPPMHLIRAMERYVKAQGGPLDYLDDVALLVALMVDHWKGPDVPSGETWPAPTIDTAVARRMQELDDLPRGDLLRLHKECLKALSLTKADQDLSGKPSESGEDDCLPTEPSTSTATSAGPSDA